MTSFAGASVLITGASSGIGRGLAQELCARGARVGLLARRQELLVGLHQELKAAGYRSAWACADVVERESLHAALGRLADQLEGCDIIIANAGIGMRVPGHEHHLSSASIDQYRVNLFGALHTIDWALPRFLQQERGHICVVASLAGYVGLEQSAAYCGSKAALRVHTQSLRLDLKPKGIPVTTICPGYVDSKMTQNSSYPLPFLMKQGQAVERMANAIERDRGEVNFPWPVAFSARLGAFLPAGLTEATVRGQGPAVRGDSEVGGVSGE